MTFKYDSHVDAEKNARNVKKYLRRWLKKIMHETIPLPCGTIADICRLRSSKLKIFVCCGQLNSTTV